MCLIVCWAFSGLVGLVMIVVAVRWFWVESIELRSDTLIEAFRGPLAPKPREFRRSEIVDIRLSRNSDGDDPMIQFTHTCTFMTSQRLLGHFLEPEHLQLLEIYLRDWLSRPGDDAKKVPRFLDLDE
jgi:hypothetical protein